MRKIKGRIRGIPMEKKCFHCGHVEKERTYSYGVYRMPKCCSQCKSNLSPRLCLLCDSPIISSRSKYCARCFLLKEQRQNKAYFQICRNRQTYIQSHKIASLKWNALNKIKANVSSLARAPCHKKDLTVLYECPCPGNNKHNHHPDYSKPFEIIRLCHNCHRFEHNKLNARIEKIPLCIGQK